MHVGAPGKVSFSFAADEAEEYAKAARRFGVSRDVAYGMLLGVVIDANEDCDLPDDLVIGAVRNVCETAVAQAWAA